MSKIGQFLARNARSIQMVLRRIAGNTYMKTRPLYELAIHLMLTMLAFTAMAESKHTIYELAMLLISKTVERKRM